MDAIKIIWLTLFFIPTILIGQESMYPKDTIYLFFDKKKHLKKELNHPDLGKNFYFEGIGVFYNQKQKADTLSIKQLKTYTFSDLKEINKKRYNWVFDNKRPPADRNGVFQTYLIEVISEEEFVIHSVIWAGEGIIE